MFLEGVPNIEKSALKQWLQDTLGFVTTDHLRSIVNPLVDSFLKQMIYRNRGLPFHPLPDNRTPYVPPVLDLESYEWFHKTLRSEVHRMGEIIVRKANWPAGFTWACAITHDVDIVRKHSFFQVLRKHPLSLLPYIQNGTAQDDPYWVFPELLEWHQSRESKATLFLLTRRREKWHYRYNPRSFLFRKLIADWHNKGHEIGLHTSFAAFEKPQRISREKSLLEILTQTPVAGMRQHYLNIRFPEAWEIIRHYRFRYDSSVGFNQSLGFRSGTCFPFFPENDNHPILEIPFSVMDYPWMAVDTSPHFPHFTQLINDIQTINGLLNIDIHPHHFVEPLFRPYWEYLWYVVSGKSIWFATLVDIATWWQQRREITLSLTRQDLHRYQLTIESISPLTGFGLEIYVPTKFTVQSSTGIIQKSDGKFVLTLPQISRGRTTLTLEVTPV